MVARIPAGCSPVRMAILPDGSRIYVTARNANAVLAFDAAKLVSDEKNASVGIAQVGAAPAPIAVVDHGKKVIVGNSNRFGNSGSAQDLVVLDARRIERDASAVLGFVRAGAFPRGMNVTTDEQTLFVVNFGSNSLQVIDLRNLPMEAEPRPLCDSGTRWAVRDVHVLRSLIRVGP